MSLPRLAFWAGLGALAAGLAAGGPTATVAGTAVLMALWWMAGAMPLAVTALVPLAVFPLAGVAPTAALAGSYAHPLIFLFLGGFVIARAIEEHGLHRALAHRLLRLAGTRPAQVVGAIMLATAFLSLWISNTAAAMVMAPMAAAIAATRTPTGDGFAPAILLGVAYAATIGGMGSLIGTPPNALFAAHMDTRHGMAIGFADWFVIGLPVSAALLGFTWLVLTRICFRLDPRPVAAAAGAEAPLGTAARRVALVGGLTAAGWIARPGIAALWPGAAPEDATVAILGALALFALPDGAGGRLMDWERAARLRWDVLLLVGGGLALAHGIETSGLASAIAGSASALSDLPSEAVLAVVAAIVVALGELASNTAMAAIFLPVADAVAAGTGADPVVFTLPVAFAASVGFMLPVATPPNAIVFGYPGVGRADMLRAGLWLNLAGLAAALAAGVLLGPLVLDTGG